MTQPKVGIDIDTNKVFAFPIDLVALSKQHVGFLQTLHQLGVTIQRPAPKSLHRYRDLWLPLVHSHPNEALIPPTDCAWLWHCHRLAPFRYTSYLKRQFGNDFQILESLPAFSFQCDNGDVYGTLMQRSEEDVNAVAERTRSLWNQEYPEETFHLQMDDANAEETVDDSSLFLDGFDLLGSTDRQANFLWQVSGPRFANDDFLKEGTLQYYKFLKLRRNANKSNVVLVPTYQIDLMWHTHILSSLSGYFDDCRAIMGSTLNHDDSLNDRSDNGPLDRAFKDTKALWKQSYDEEYFAKGGMYRGEPPKEYFKTSWLSRFSNEEAQIPMGPFLHMIDRQGASSTNPNDGSANFSVDDLTYEDLANATWTPLSGTAPDGSPAYIQMAMKSKVKGVNENPFKEDYIFGKMNTQVGYFHITTREANAILAKRIGARIKRFENDAALAACCTLGLCSNAKWKKKMDEQIETMRTTKSITEARSKADAPFGKVGIPDKYKDNKQVCNMHYSEAGAWIFPTAYYECGGGCGGGAIGKGNSSSASGASACGAGACGAAACVGGGGGCGGGGCGGGGCGG